MQPFDPGAPVEIERLPVPGQAGPMLTPPGGAPGAPKVALLLPLSGPQAGLGRALLDAATMALFEVAGDRLVLLPKDTAGTPDGARFAAEQASAEGANLILGPIFRDAAAAAGPVAAARGLSLITFSTDSTVAGGNVFLFGFTPEQQVSRVVKYAVERDLLRFAALAPENAYGAAVTRALQQAAAEAGGSVTRLESYPTDGRNLETAVERLAGYQARKAALAARKRELAASDSAAARRELADLANREALNEYEFDALLLPEGGQTLRNLAPLLTYYEIDTARVKVLGTSQWEDPSLGREPALRGAWFAAASPRAAQEFQRRYERAYGRKPPRIASLAYDAVALAAALAQSGAGMNAEALRNPSGFAGVDGIFRFGPDNVAERGLAVLEVGPDGFRVISEAPQTFEPRAF
jgi:ABC-type branched-subunit amino acid transport system substrate-binding protein